jgi:predicted RNase H-like nuclease (RuvC/YqgF family)
MPDKLTDSEIVKAVKSYEEKILANGIKSLEPFEVREIVEQQQEEINRLQAENKSQSIMIKMLKGSIEDYKNSYINQKAENERLQEAIDEQDIEISRLYKRIDEAKAEAYKEFAERLKENSIATFSFKGVVMVEEIDNLLKELVGEDNESKN